MPGDDALYSQEYGVQDLLPSDEDEQLKILGWVLEAFTSSDSAKRDYERKWLRFDKLYSSQIRKRAGDWRSALFLPYVFSTIEGITPMLLADLPKFLVTGVRDVDVDASKLVESKLDWSLEHSVPTFSVELLKAQKSALKYGTGITKNFHVKDERTYYQPQPMMQPVVMDQLMMDPETGLQQFDLEGAPMTEEVPQVDPMTGQPAMEPVLDEKTGEPLYQQVEQTYTYYDGPASKYVDILDFFPAPEALDIEDARYVIHRVFKDLWEVKKKIKDGLYHAPPQDPDGEPSDAWVAEDSGILKRLKQLGIGTGEDTTKQKVELLECWTKALPGYEGKCVVVTVLNRRAIIRMQYNPFWHHEYPFSRFVDYLQEGSFWGKGEIEAIEGLQDFANAIANQRIDNVKLAMNKQVAVSTELLEDEDDLTSAPGKRIRVKTGVDPRTAVMPIETQDVTASAYVEADYVERMIERVTGLSPNMTGLSSNEAYNETATAAALLQEAGNTKFAMKLRMMEIVGLTPLARQWGAIIQQFTTEEETVQRYGQAGEVIRMTLTPENVQGAMAYSIKSQSSATTQATRLEQSMRRLQTVAPFWPVATPRLIQDYLEAEGVKNTADYLSGSLGLISTLALLGLQKTGIPTLTQFALTGTLPMDEEAQAEEGAPAEEPPPEGAY